MCITDYIQAKLMFTKVCINLRFLQQIFYLFRK